MTDDRPTLDTSSPAWRALRALLFRLDAERAHRLAMAALSSWSSACSVQLPSSHPARAPSLAREVLGLRFPNPLGLAAGFDKDAEAVPAWIALGFGFVEVGTVTAKAQPGNEKPRLFRLPADRALLNRLGFNNHGARACAEALGRFRLQGRVTIPVGVNIGKSKVTPNEEAKRDYQESFAAVADVADYVVVNVSSPNTPGLRDLQKTDELRAILDAVCEPNQRRATPRPILVKLAPDLSDDDAHACAETAIAAGVQGLVVSNTTISRAGLTAPVPDGPGGVSGAPLFSRSTALLRSLTAAHKPKLAFIGVGGVMDAPTLQAKLDAGADLVQSYTGFIYGGPRFVPRTLRELVAVPPNHSSSSEAERARAAHDGAGERSVAR